MNSSDCFLQGTAEWKHMSNGSVPENAFVAASKKEQLFVARAKHENGIQPCQLNEKRRGAEMLYGGEEIIKDTYDVLAASNGLFWKDINVGGLPRDSLKTGNEANGNALYSVKCKIAGKRYIGKYNGNDKAYFGVDGKEKEITSGEMKILCFRESSPEKTVSNETEYFYCFLRKK